MYDLQFQVVVHTKMDILNDPYQDKYLVVIELADVAVYTFTPRDRLPYDPDYIQEIVEEAKKTFAIQFAVKMMS